MHVPKQALLMHSVICMIPLMSHDNTQAARCMVSVIQLDDLEASGWQAGRHKHNQSDVRTAYLWLRLDTS